MQPLVDGASKLAGALVPGVGMAVSKSARMLDAIAKMKINSVPPQTKGFEWYVAKVTRVLNDEPGKSQVVVQGVVWELPKNMFIELGGRLTGSLAVSFIPAPQQGEKEATKGAPLRLQAVVCSKDNPAEEWAPSSRSFIDLWVDPR